MTVLICILIALLLIAVAIIAFASGVAFDSANKVKKLKERGWTIEPPKEETE